jgi:MFS family permease
MFLLSNLNMNSTFLQSSIFLMLVGLGNGLFQTPNSSAIMGSVPENRLGIASGMLATMRNIGMVLGIAIAGAVFTGQQNHLSTALKMKGIVGEPLRVQAFTGAFHTTYLMAGCLALVAVVASLTRGPLRKVK